MKKVALSLLSCLLLTSLFAQDSINPKPQKKKPTIDLSNRANDHFLIQLGYTTWAGQPDSIETGGFSKSLNFYLMMDFPFKTNPKLSIGVGAGISSDQIQFKRTYVGIKENTPMLTFTDVSDTNHFKKVKLTTAYLEAPIEIRFTARPMDSDHSFKWAIGVKVGTMLDAHTRNKELQTKDGQTINDYKMKEASKRYFNTTRLVGTARIGWGHFTVYGSYQITNLFKEGVAPVINPFTVGLTLSGL